MADIEAIIKNVSPGSVVEEYTAQWGILVEKPIVDYKRDTTNLIGWMPLLQAIKYDTIRVGDDYRDKVNLSDMAGHALASTNMLHGLDNRSYISEKVDIISDFALELNPYEETKEVFIENGEKIILILQSDSGYTPSFEDKDFVEGFKKNNGSPKKAIKYAGKWKKENPGMTQLFTSMF